MFVALFRADKTEMKNLCFLSSYFHNKLGTMVIDFVPIPIISQ
jgi:hypothetical protein